jgi:hypothetical protein
MADIIRHRVPPTVAALTQDSGTETASRVEVTPDMGVLLAPSAQFTAGPTTLRVAAVSTVAVVASAVVDSTAEVSVEAGASMAVAADSTVVVAVTANSIARNAGRARSSERPALRSGLICCNCSKFRSADKSCAFDHHHSCVCESSFYFRN